MVQAKQIRRNKIQNFLELTDEEKYILERGFVTIDTINRIESKQAQLQNLIRKMGYSGEVFSNKVWQHGDYFVEDDLLRLFKNNDELRQRFFVYSDTPPRMEASYGFEEFNGIEKTLYDIEKIINFVKSNYRVCNGFYCGED